MKRVRPAMSIVLMVQPFGPPKWRRNIQTDLIKNRPPISMSRRMSSLNRLTFSISCLDSEPLYMQGIFTLML